ncbi:MAG: hypothetical protein Nk1A_0600 [Endomicrobiia bacterium]|nr:MAG: hypothetical protein Nk1A_0600 [Endomicrobiia bacterium]
MSDNKDTLLAFILGGLLGTVLGVLYAPRSGKETRNNIKKLGEKISDKVNDLNSDFKETSRKLYEESRNKIYSGKDKINEAFKAGKKVFEELSKKD